MIEQSEKAPLVGTAFMIMWHDIAPEADAEYNLWHTREHMPERIALPGFLRARRGVNHALPRQRYFTMYEGEALSTFLSEGYARSLNFPTAWTTRVAPHFRNFLRMSCAISETRGRGVGGALMTLRLSLNPGAREEDALTAAPAVLDALMDLDSVSGAHVGVARPGFSEQATKETALRPQMAETPFDLVLIVEGIGLAPLERDAARIAGICAALPAGGTVMQSYDMAYMLTRGPM
jgi:hypothetical protein